MNRFPEHTPEDNHEKHHCNSLSDREKEKPSSGNIVSELSQIPVKKIGIFSRLTFRMTEGRSGRERGAARRFLGSGGPRVSRTS
jgi:hypothetical protein